MCLANSLIDKVSIIQKYFGVKIINKDAHMQMASQKEIYHFREESTHDFESIISPPHYDNL